MPTKITYRVALEVLTHEAIVRQAYKNPGDVWTWSVGLTSATGHDVTRYIGKPQPLEDCLRVYVWALNNYADAVRKAFAGVDLTEAQFAAALSFHWNTGKIASASWVKSFRAGQMAQARKNFLAYNKPASIAERRKAEAALLFDGVWSQNGKAVEYTRVKLNRARTEAPIDWSSRKTINVEKELKAALSEAKVETPAAADPQLKVYTDVVHVKIVQRELDELGYNTGSKRADGSFDGKLGDLTAAAILASKRENGFEPVDDRITDAYIEALSGFSKRKLERQTLTPVEVRERAPEVQTNYVQKVGGGALGVAGFIGATYKSIMEALGDTRTFVEPFIASVPWWAWAGAAVAVGGYFFYQGRRGEKAGIEAFKKGGR